MSKIYEALLRAELERANKTGPGHHGAQPTAVLPPDELVHEAERYSPEPQPQFHEEPAPLPLAAWPTPPAPGPAPAPAYPWSPTEAPWTSPEAPSSVLPAANFTAPLTAPTVAAATPVQAAASAPVFAPAPAAVSDLDLVRTVAWSPVSTRLPTLLERGRSVEQFRSLRSRLAEFRDSSVPLKTLLVTSGLPQEGKSFIAANLALSLARHRANRVLLIDGDIRRSSLHAILGTTAEPGLTEYLSGHATAFEVLQRNVPEEAEAPLHSGLSSLFFIAGGSEPDKAVDLSGNPRFSDLLKTLSPLFDWVIIDSSPVNLVSDGVNFARACDGVLLVAREGVTKFETAQAAQQQLKSARILGCVLNAVHTPSTKTDEYNYGSYGSYGGYGNYGGYGYSTTAR